jgi:hypothetical protein
VGTGGGTGWTFTALPALLLLAGCFGIPAADAPAPDIALAPAPAPVTAPASAVTVRVCTEAGADPKDRRWDRREAVCLKELGQHASRKGNLLSLKIDNGTTKTFRSNHAACEKEDDYEKCWEYDLTGFYTAPGAYLVRTQNFENYAFTLVNIHTGEAKEVEGVPRLAPDNSTYFVSSLYDGCRISIGSMASSSARPAWENNDDSHHDDCDWNFVRWIDNDRVALRIRPERERCPQGDCEAILRRTGASWKLETLPRKSGGK